MNEPAIDLGIVLAIISSKLDLTIDEKTICFGEVGLSGEVRGVTMAEQRVAEAAKLGFRRCILPSVSAQRRVLRELNWLASAMCARRLKRYSRK